jgi:transcriptional antiterminator RfaH
VVRRGRGELGLLPLFPCYLFAKFDLRERYFDVRYLPGVAGLVSAGAEPIPVPPLVVDEIKRRGVDGIVEAMEGALKKDDHVRVIEGPFKDFDAIFERYVSSAERVAILLGTVGAGGLRVVLPSAAVVARTKN